MNSKLNRSVLDWPLMSSMILPVPQNSMLMCHYLYASSLRHTSLIRNEMRVQCINVILSITTYSETCDGSLTLLGYFMHQVLFVPLTRQNINVDQQLETVLCMCNPTAEPILAYRGVIPPDGPK